MTPLDQYFERLPEEVRDMMLALQQHLLLSRNDLQLQEKYKWATPTYFFEGRPIVYLYHRKKERRSYLAFMAGKHLRHEALQAFNLKLIRFIPLDPQADLPIEAIDDCLDQAAAFVRSGKSLLGPVDQ